MSINSSEEKLEKPHNQVPDQDLVLQQKGPKIDVSALPTPNPNALKFILNVTLKTEGKTTYRNPEESAENPLAQALFAIEGVENLHFFQNTLTVTKGPLGEWDQLEQQIITCLEDMAPAHDPNFHDPDSEDLRRKGLSPELLEIEEILDRTIRPGLQGDGGDIVCVDYKNEVLLVRYQGACGTCPSSSAGTLEAIKGILRDELDREIDVYIVPE